MPAGINNVSAQSTLLTAQGYEQIQLNSGTPVALSPPADAQLAIINAELNTIRFRDDGTPPTTTVGQPIVKFTTLQYNVRNLANCLLIESSDGSAIANVSYYSYPQEGEN